MVQALACIALQVPSNYEGLAVFPDALGLIVLEETELDPDKRSVVVAPPVGAGATVLLAVPSDERQREKIGDQTGGRGGYFRHNDDFRSEFRAMRARHVRFLETPRREPYGLVAVFVDPRRGKWDLLQQAGVNGEID